MSVVLKKYHFEGTDYLVGDFSGNMELFYPSQLRLLCNRRQGIGADVFLALVKNGNKSGLDVFSADGELQVKTEADKQVLLRYIQEQHFLLKQTDLTDIFGSIHDWNMLDDVRFDSIEVRLTESFIEKLRASIDTKTEYAS